ncbi:MAG: DUF2190 family protein [Rhodospirillaceae bacterium]|nr:DUF2190 family protein [Rhodospirillaceae bacterium]
MQIDVGDRLFWDATNKVVNKTATAQVCVGVAVSAAANPECDGEDEAGGAHPGRT